MNYRVTFKEYLNTIKIGHACNLLSEKDLNIMEVAYACGYHNMANFNKQFKKLKKMSPREYRKEIRYIIPSDITGGVLPNFTPIPV